MSGFLLGQFRFGSKEEAKQHVYAILRRNSPGKPISGADAEFVLALIEAHPRQRVIVDCGLAYAFVQDLGNGQRRFCVRRIDASIRDFSWRNCLTPPAAGRRVASVCRHLISEQIKTFRGIQPEVVNCAHCSREISRTDLHIDHEPPRTFATLLEGWLNSIHLRPEDIELIDKTGYMEQTRLEDSFLEESWREYHEINARLRGLCPACNLGATRRRSAA